MLKKISFCLLAALLICLFCLSTFAYSFSAGHYVFSKGYYSIDLDRYFELVGGDTLYYYEWDDSSAPLYYHVDGYGDLAVTQFFISNDYYAGLMLENGNIVGNDASFPNYYAHVVTVFVTSGSSDSIFTGQDFIDISPAITYLGSGEVQDSLFGTFSSIFSWLGGVLLSIVSLFWLNGSLTLFGVCAIIGLGIGLFFLAVHLISNFFHFRS